MVNVTPEVSSSAVLMVGSQRPHGGNGFHNPGGRTRGPAATLGPDGLEVGPENGVVEAASAGTEWGTRPVQAVKKAPKNITSEKNEPAHAPAVREVDLAAVQAPFAFRWRIAEPLVSTKATSQAQEQRILPQSFPLIHWLAPRITKNRPAAAMMGWRDSAGKRSNTGLRRGLADHFSS